jgi:arginine decarboxylase
MISQKKTVSAPYYSIGQLRLDKWNELKIEGQELIKSKSDSATEAKHKGVIGKLLSDLAIVETYFAIPGKTIIEKLVRSFDKGDYGLLSQVITSSTRKIVDDIYSGNPNVSQGEEDEESENELVSNTRQSSQKNGSVNHVMLLSNLS